MPLNELNDLSATADIERGHSIVRPPANRLTATQSSRRTRNSAAQADNDLPGS